MKDPGDYPFLDLLALSTMTLATVSNFGQPHAAPVYFVAGKDLQVYFFSGQDSQHALDLEHNSAAAGAIYPESSGWQDIQGVQMRGNVHVVEPGPVWEAAWSAYSQKFPFVKGLPVVVARNRLYCFSPGWVRMLDNRFGLGYKREWNLEQQPEKP